MNINRHYAPWIALLAWSIASGCASRLDTGVEVALKSARPETTAIDRDDATAAVDSALERAFAGLELSVNGARVHTGDPLIDAIAGPLRDRRSIDARFARVLEHALRAGERRDAPIAVALAEGPIDVDGIRYLTLGDYLDRTLEQRDAWTAAAPARFAARLTDRVRALVRNAGGDVVDVTDRRAAGLLAIRRQTLEYLNDAPLHPASTRMLRDRGVAWSVRSTLRRTLSGYDVILTAHHLASGGVLRAAESIDPLYTAALDDVTTGQE